MSKGHNIDNEGGGDMNHSAVHILREADGRRSNRLTLYATLEEAKAACEDENTVSGVDAVLVEEVSDTFECQWGRSAIHANRIELHPDLHQMDDVDGTFPCSRAYDVALESTDYVHHRVRVHAYTPGLAIAAARNYLEGQDIDLSCEAVIMPR